MSTLLLLPTLCETTFTGLVSKWSDKSNPSRKIKGKLLLDRHRVPVNLIGEPEPDTRPMIEVDGRLIPDPDMHKCAFCPAYVHTKNATFGSGGLQQSFRDEITMVHGIKVVTRKLIRWTSKLVACPQCCLELTKGDKKTKFPETVG